MLTGTVAQPAAGPPANRHTGTRRASTMPGGVRVCGILLVALSSAALAFAVVRPVQVLPFLRPAPPVIFHDADGGIISSARLAGTVLVFQVSALRCPGPCEDGHQALQTLQRRLETAPPAVPVRFVTVVLDGQRQPTALRRQANLLETDPRWWRLATADAVRLKSAVGAGFGVYYTADQNGRIAFEPGTFLVDERGIVRAEYRTAPPDPARIGRDLDLVLREASTQGAARAAYTAAHLFLCYPR